MAGIVDSEASACSPDSILSTKIIPESSFFRDRQASALPSPAEIRALNEKSGHYRATLFNRPCPVYGADVTVAEAETQILMRQLLQGQVPIPEVFGWAVDGAQTFIYMAWIRGDTLQSRFANLDESERQAVCKELKGRVDAWRTLVQDESDTYIGTVGKRPFNDIFVSPHAKLAGPFQGLNAVQEFHDACHIDISGQIPITFTHNDLCPPNILLSQGPNPKLVAILDFGQSGWYPWYWEYCKARRVGRLEACFDSALQEEWHVKYLPLVIDPVDSETYYYPWLYFMLSKI
ncbi:kinase-like domain-containing protein [Xylariales sp. AK1849]|nr:kinase-like domain-containing protein [Xylariales sp. AK1849]